MFQDQKHQIEALRRKEMQIEGGYPFRMKKKDLKNMSLPSKDLQNLLCKAKSDTQQYAALLRIWLCKWLCLLETIVKGEHRTVVTADEIIEPERTRIWLNKIGNELDQCIDSEDDVMQAGKTVCEFTKILHLR
jgi:hypothetical protein